MEAPRGGGKSRLFHCFLIGTASLEPKGNSFLKHPSAFQPGLTQNTVPDEEVRTRLRVLVKGLLKQALGVLF